MTISIIAPLPRPSYAIKVPPTVPQWELPEVSVALAPGLMSDATFEAWTAFVLCHLPQAFPALSLRRVARLPQGEAGQNGVGCSDEELRGEVVRWLRADGWERFTFELAFGILG